MSQPSPRRSMVRVLRNRILVVVAVTVAMAGAASVWGLRIVTDRNAERQVQIASQSVMTWGTPRDGARIIDGGRLAAVDAASTVVALFDGEGHVVVATSGLPLSIDVLESIPDSLDEADTVRVEAGSGTILFTEVPLEGDVVLVDGTPTPVARALVGIRAEGADRLVTALALATVGLLVVVLAVVAVLVTVIVTRTTRSLTELARRVESGSLDGVEDAPATEFGETEAIAEAIVRLDRRRDSTERQLRDFVADASHELRTPLTKIQGWSELYFQGPAEPELADRAFQHIATESGRMHLLVDKLALLARAESGTQPREPVDLTATCREVVDEVVLMDTDATVRMEPTEPFMVLGDPAALTQVVRNLVGNALLHAGPDVVVTMALTSAGAQVEMSVTDNGRGMPAAIRDRAFERFVTGDGGSGTGLGLSIVQAIVVSCGGTVDLASNPGQGTRVTVRLPRAPG